MANLRETIRNDKFPTKFQGFPSGKNYIIPMACGFPRVGNILRSDLHASVAGKPVKLVVSPDGNLRKPRGNYMFPIRDVRETTGKSQVSLRKHNGN